MKSVKEIRDDLKNIRYFFSRKNFFDEVSTNIGENTIKSLIQTYQNAICYAPPRLYDLYVSLYMQNITQEELSYQLGYSPEHISRLNGQLVKFLQTQLANQEVC